MKITFPFPSLVGPNLRAVFILTQICFKLRVVINDDFPPLLVDVVEMEIAGFPPIVFDELRFDGLDAVAWLPFEDFVFGFALAV